MAGVVKDGILQVSNSGGGGTPVDITSPLGPNTSANSVSVTLATDQSSIPVTETKEPLTPSAPSAASVGVVSSTVVASNVNRKGLVLTNVSNARISLAFDNAAILDSGITLYPGGTFEMDEFLFLLGSVTAIASAASSGLGIQELTT